MTINVGFDTKSIKNAINQLKKVRKTYPQMVVALLQRSCEWIRDRAIVYLSNSDLGMNVIVELINDFHIENNGTTAILRNGEGRGYMVEFGIGIVGEGTYDGFLPPNYQYNVPSEYKNEDGEWSFYANEEDLDIPQSAVTSWVNLERQNQERYFVYTKGTKGVMFMYNALTDFRSQGQAQRIWSNICKEYLK